MYQTLPEVRHKEIIKTSKYELFSVYITTRRPNKSIKNNKTAQNKKPLKNRSAAFLFFLSIRSPIPPNALSITAQKNGLALPDKGPVIIPTTTVSKIAATKYGIRSASIRYACMSENVKFIGQLKF